VRNTHDANITSSKRDRIRPSEYVLPISDDSEDLRFMGGLQFARRYPDQA
jgi:hypothetical protein